MAAYTAVISLLQTLEQLQQRNQENIRVQIAETLDSLHATAVYFQKVLEESSNKSRFDLEKIKSLEEKIRDAASDAEDVVELKICQIIKGSRWKIGTTRKILHWNLLPIVEKMETTKKEVMEIVSDFSTSIHDADQILELSGDSLFSTSSTSNLVLPNLEDVIVQGLDDDLEIIVKRLTGPLSDLDIVTISGMGGIGKTTLATKAHDHLAIRYHFDIRVWVTISQEYRSRNVSLAALYCILKQTNFVNGKDYDKKDDNELADLVQKKLKGRRYLVVVDDIWSTDVWDSIRQIFPNCNNRSRILLTTRDTKVAMYANTNSPHEMKLLNLDNSWKLLRDKVFGSEHDHSLELENIGKKIVEKCQGLPLSISVIAGHLSKVEMTVNSWKVVARTLSEIVVSHPNKCLGVLGLSYHHLPNHLKPCFLSMSGFPEDFEVETCRLIQLWIAEDFIKASGNGKSLEEVANDYLEDLICRNLIMVRKRRFNGEIKACGMHDLLHEFCLTEAEITNFMHVKRTNATLPTQKHNVRRYSVQTETYSIENCCKQLPPASSSIYLFSETQSSLKLEVFSRFNLLRVLAIFHENERFDSFPLTLTSSFPLVITKLFHLRYLAIACCGDLPASISELQNLRTLIIHQNGYKDITLPGKIWMMNLRQIHLGGTYYLPRPRREWIQNKHLPIGMSNLEELFGPYSSSCINEVFSAIPSLKRLIIRVSCYGRDHLDNHLIDMSSLTKLEALKCVSDTTWPIQISIKRLVFPTSLKRLTLAGEFRFPWEDISSSLVMLPNLEELKLKDNAFSGNVWRLTDDDKFETLKLLLLSGLFFEHWEANSDSFPILKRLVLKNCRYLKEIPTDFGEISTLESIELHNCSTPAEDSAREIEQEQEDMGNNCLKVYIHSNHMRE